MTDLQQEMPTPGATASTAGMESSSANPLAQENQHENEPKRINSETLAVCALVFGIFAMIVAVFAVGLAARAVEQSSGSTGGSSKAGASDAPASVEVSMKEFAFNPSDIKIAEGGKLDLKNDGAMAHDLAVGDLASEMIDPGGSGELDLSGLAPGTYTFFCQVAGHEAAGMKGTITVQ